MIYGSISILYIDNEFRFLSFLMVVTITIYFIVKIRDKRAILYAFITEIINSISEIVISIVLLLIIGIDSKLMITDYKINLIANISMSMFGIILIMFKKTKEIAKKIIGLFEKNKKLINYFYVFIVVLYLLVLKNGFEFLVKTNYYINVLFILGLFVILVMMISNERKKESLKEQYKQMLSYVTKYEKIITEQGKANHEYKNQLMVIRGYAQMNNIPKLTAYLDSIIKDYKKTQSSYLIKELNKFPEGGIKGLLYYKLSMMEDEKIKYIIDVESGIKTKLKGLKVEEYKNITKILGVLLDNAIESSKKSKKKNVIINVEKSKNEVIFSVSNTYKGKIKIEKIGTGYTSKGTKHGYGLKLVKDIIENNKGYGMNNYLEDDYYVCKLKVNINRKTKRS